MSEERVSEKDIKILTPMDLEKIESDNISTDILNLTAFFLNNIENEITLTANQCETLSKIMKQTTKTQTP